VVFESAEIGNRVDKEAYNLQAPDVRVALLHLQGDLKEAGLPVLVIIGGVEGAGKGETVNLLLEWLDARGVRTYAFGEPSDEERERPRFWRYWRALPGKGRIGIFFGAWHTQPIVDRVFKRLGRARFDQELDRIADLERMLTADGVLILKFWMHLSKKAQRARLKELEKDPKLSWKVTKREWKFFELYDDFREVSEHALRRTSAPEAPWHVIEASDARYRNLTVTTIIREAIQSRLDELKEKPAPAREKPPLPAPRPINILNSLDLTRALPDEDYEKALLKYQSRLNRLHRELPKKGRSLALLFEGPDAAGKGGTIRRVIQAMDARAYQVISVAAPTEEERQQPYLWRFWRHLPRQGHVTLYDRSWYGRVLVERLEGFCPPADWNRAYTEINAFEEQQADFGTILVKFWLHVSPEEQLRRFQEREHIAYKQYKITEEDWRNREKWNGYEAAACDMIERTSTDVSPWVLIEANDKNWARVRVLKTVCHRLEEALG